MGTSVLHIKTEVECHVYLFDEEKGIAKPGTYFNLEVRKGEQDLLYVSTEDEGVICFKSYNVEEDDCNYRMTLEQSQFINVSTPATEEEISSGVEDEFGVIYSHDGLQLLSVWNDMFIEYHIQDGCKVIRGCAFSECINLTAITLPAGLTHIGNRAFSSCNLTTITLPASLTYIGDCAFSGTGIRNVVSLSPNFTFRDGCLIDQLRHRLIAYLSDNSKVSLPVGLTHIGNEAFYMCDKLSAITLPNSLTHIGYDGEPYTDFDLVKSTRGLDIVVGGHSHTFIPKPGYENNLDGMPVPIVQNGCWGLEVGNMKVYKK